MGWNTARVIDLAGYGHERAARAAPAPAGPVFYRMLVWFWVPVWRR
jgi:hypothetical protein